MEILIPVGLVIWFLGAAYCMGYETLVSGDHEWFGSLVWSFHAVLPWFIMYEWTKRRYVASKKLPISFIIGLIVATFLLSLGIEYLLDTAFETERSSLVLQAIRRLPAIAVVLLLLVALPFSETARIDKIKNFDTWLIEQAEIIYWIKAADNYVEIQFENYVETRRCTLNAAEKALKACRFIRIHRSYLANMRFASMLDSNEGKLVLKMHDDSNLPVGKKNEAAVRREMSFTTSPQTG